MSRLRTRSCLPAAMLGLAATSTLATPPTATVRIAPSKQALTFARAPSPAGPQLIMVSAYQDGTVTGTDVAQVFGAEVRDPIALLHQLAYDDIRTRMATAPASATMRVPAATLTTPVDLAAQHVAAGTNYPAHADEAAIDSGPFLFAKLVEATPATAPVSVGNALLDYEVELAWVAIDPIVQGAPIPRIGLILCNDYTDRATLLAHVDPWDPGSGKGFTTGKSFPGYLPVGDLFIVPRDPRAFATTVELRLWVNDTLRQQARVAGQIWDLDELLAQTWARRDVRWDHRGASVALPGASGTIPARTMVMSGTPAGTVFQGVPLTTKLTGAAHWLLGGWATPLTTQVVDAYIRQARRARTYLQPHDRVLIHVDGLGVIDNRIVP